MLCPVKNPFIFIWYIGLLFSSFIILGIASPKVEFFPENEPQQIFVYMEYPEGTSIQKTNQTSKLIEKEVAKIIYDKKYYKSGKNFMIDSNVVMVGWGTKS